jgi:hypothetical protein
MTVFRPDQKDIRFEAELQGHPLYVREWEPVRNWLARFREAATPIHYYELHHELFARFYSWQQFEAECKKREQQERDEINAARKRGTSTGIQASLPGAEDREGRREGSCGHQSDLQGPS